MGRVRNVDWTFIKDAGLMLVKINTIESGIFLASAVFVLVALLLSSCASAAPTAAFTISYLNGSCFNTTSETYKGQVLYFNDTSAGGPTTWAWDFGDGWTSASRNATHAYTFGKLGHMILLKNGWKEMPVTLTVSDGAASSTITHSVNLTTPLMMYSVSSANVTMLNDSASQAYLEAIGGNTTVPTDWGGIDWILGIQTTESVYTQIIGVSMFLILIFSLPFIMNWIITKDFNVAGILGGFLGIYIIVRLPTMMRLLAVTFIGLSIVAIIYSLLKER